MTTEQTSNASPDESGWTARLAMESARKELFGALIDSDPQMTVGEANAQTDAAIAAAYAVASESLSDEDERLHATAQSVSEKAAALTAA